jgi:hypothetical protein
VAEVIGSLENGRIDTESAGTGLLDVVLRCRHDIQS